MDPACSVADSKKVIQAFETKCIRKLFHISYLGAQNQRLGAEQDKFPSGSTGTSSGNCQETESEKLAWFGHVTHHDSLSKTILQGISKGG